MNIRIMLLKIRLKYFTRFAGKYDFNEILRSSGIRIGQGTIFYNPNSMTIDRERPWMLQIGEYCKITKGVTILTHDYSRSVLRRYSGEIIGEAGETIIGNNVFIGMNSIILMGTHIGNNVIVGAGSVISGNIPDNCVVAGNPARIIRTIDEHYSLRKKRYFNECITYYKSFLNNYHRIPNEREMGPFFPIFLERSIEKIRESGVNVKLNGDNVDEVVDDFMKSKGMFSSYKEFVDYMENNKLT